MVIARVFECVGVLYWIGQLVVLVSDPTEASWAMWVRPSCPGCEDDLCVCVCFGGI